MAGMTCTIRVRRKWWVPLYMVLCRAFAWSVAPFIDLDDGRFDAWCEREARFIALHGHVLEYRPKGGRWRRCSFQLTEADLDGP